MLVRNYHSIEKWLKESILDIGLCSNLCFATHCVASYLTSQVLASSSVKLKEQRLPLRVVMGTNGNHR